MPHTAPYFVRNANRKPRTHQETLTFSEVCNLADAWILDGETAQRSPRTIEERKALREKLIWFLNHNGHDECGTIEMRNFLAYVATGHLRKGGRWGNADHPAALLPVKPSTVASYHRNLRAMLRWGLAQGEIGVYPLHTVTAPTVQQDQVTPFTPAQTTALLAACKRTHWPKRATALVLFMLDTGARRAEVCALKLADIDLTNRRCTVIGKGRKTRVLPLGRHATKALWAYQAERPADADRYFVAAQGELAAQSLTESGLFQIVQHLGTMAGLENVRCSPHTFRHTFAVEFLRSGGSELALQELLGHTSLNTVRRYVKFAAADIQAQHALHSPADRLLRR